MKAPRDDQEMRAMLDVAADIDDRMKYYIDDLKQQAENMHGYTWATEEDIAAALHKYELAQRFRDAVLAAINPVDF